MPSVPGALAAAGLAVCATGGRIGPVTPSTLWRTRVGCTRWPSPNCTNPFFRGTDSSPSLQDDSLVIGAYGGSDGGMIGGLYSVERANGAVRWSAADRGGEGSPEVSSTGVVYASTYQGLFALDGPSGATMWEWRPPDGGKIGSSGGLDESIGLIFAGSLGRAFYAVNASTGRTVWTYTTSATASSCAGERSERRPHLARAGRGGGGGVDVQTVRPVEALTA